MKKLIAFVLAAVSCFAVTACGNTNSAKGNDFTVLKEDFGAEEYGIGLRKGDVAFATELQKVLDQMVKDGKTAEISKKWFGADLYFNDAKLPKELTPVSGDESLKKIQDKKKIILGLDDNFPPMGFRDANGKIVGFDIDLATEAAKRMGVELQLQPIDWDAKELELNGGKIDVIWNGLTITPERLDAMTFTKPYTANRQVIIVPANSKIKAKADLAGKTVGLQKGSSSLDALNKDEATKKTLKTVTEYPDNLTAFLDLKAGRIDAFVVDEIAGRYILANQAK